MNTLKIIHQRIAPFAHTAGLIAGMAGKSPISLVAYGISSAGPTLDLIDEMINGKVENNEEILRNLHVMDTFTTKSDPEYMASFVQYAFYNKKTEVKMDNQEKRTLQNFTVNIGEPKTFMIPHDGIIFLNVPLQKSAPTDPESFKRFCIKMDNSSAGYIHLSILVAGEKSDLEFYNKNLKPFILLEFKKKIVQSDPYFPKLDTPLTDEQSPLINIKEPVPSSESRLFQRYELESGDWILRYYKRGSRIPMTVKTDIQDELLHFLYLNQTEIINNNMNRILLIGSNNCGKSETAMRIALFLNLNFYKFCNEYNFFHVQECRQKIKPYSVIDISDIGWKLFNISQIEEEISEQDASGRWVVKRTGKFVERLVRRQTSSIEENSIRDLIDSDRMPSASLVIFSCNPEYFPVFRTIVPGFLRRINVLVDFNKKNNQIITNSVENPDAINEYYPVLSK